MSANDPKRTSSLSLPYAIAKFLFDLNQIHGLRTGAEASLIGLYNEH